MHAHLVVLVRVDVVKLVWLAQKLKRASIKAGEDGVRLSTACSSKADVRAVTRARIGVAWLIQACPDSTRLQVARHSQTHSKPQACLLM